jgi:HAD superfamily hydrolase (TIGR01490 family)
MSLASNLVPARRPRIAFFDFDGTLVTGDSGLLCASRSARDGLLPPWLLAEFVLRYLLYKLGLGTRSAMQRVGFRCYRGRTLESLRAATEILHREILVRHLSPAMEAAATRHREAGDRLVILTGAAHFFAEPLGRAFSFDEVHGTRLVYDDRGVCTGHVDERGILDGERKLHKAAACAAAHGADLADCAFYTDHVADLPLLEVVGRPVVVGAASGLAAHVKRRGWPHVAHHDALHDGMAALTNAPAPPLEGA